MPTHVEAEAPGGELRRAEPAIGGQVRVLADVHHRTPDVDDKRADRARVLGCRPRRREKQELDGHTEHERGAEARSPGERHSREYTGGARSPFAILPAT